MRVCPRRCVVSIVSLPSPCVMITLKEHKVWNDIKETKGYLHVPEKRWGECPGHEPLGSLPNRQCYWTYATWYGKMRTPVHFIFRIWDFPTMGKGIFYHSCCIKCLSIGCPNIKFWYALQRYFGPFERVAARIKTPGPDLSGFMRCRTFCNSFCQIVSSYLFQEYFILFHSAPGVSFRYLTESYGPVQPPNLLKHEINQPSQISRLFPLFLIR